MDIAAFLKSESPLFRDFPEDKLKVLAAGGHLLDCAPGESLARCGDDASFLGVVLDGEVVATAPGEGGRPETLIRFQRGETFNELGLMTGDKLIADLTVSMPSKVLTIPLELFQTTILTSPAALQTVSRTVARRMTEILADPARAAAARNGPACR